MLLHILCFLFLLVSSVFQCFILWMQHKLTRNSLQLLFHYKLICQFYGDPASPLSTSCFVKSFSSPISAFCQEDCQRMPCLLLFPLITHFLLPGGSTEVEINHRQNERTMLCPSVEHAAETWSVGFARGKCQRVSTL